MQFQNITEDQEKEITKILKKYKDFFNLIIMDPKLVDDSKYKVYGKFNPSTGILRLNPHVFTANDFKDEATGRIMTMLQYVILHEIGHEVYINLSEEDKEEWANISGWLLNPTIKEGYKNLIIPEDGKKTVSNWYYKAEAENSFPRWYAKKNPKEDFVDCWAFIQSGLTGRFTDDIGQKKILFINRV